MPSEADEQLIANERRKFMAGYLNTGATASFTVGVLGPLAAASYGFGGANVPPGTLATGGVSWFAASAGLHWPARFVLGRLRA